MKKNKLAFEYKFDFDLAGIICHQKEYKLAWHLNFMLNIEFVKQPDIAIEFSNQVSILISNFKYESDSFELTMLRNRLVSGRKYPFLIPELEQFDYLLKIKDRMEKGAIKNICTKIRAISFVEYVVKLNFDELKSRENLLY